MPTARSRKRRTQQPPEEEDETNETPAPSPEPLTQRQRIIQDLSDDEDFREGDAAATQGNLDELVKKFVRLALACEFQRRPIRRIDVSEKVLGSNSRQFKAVFNETQLRLGTVFGMKMVELPTRANITLQQKRAKNASQNPKTTTSWILTSILPSPFRDPAIIQPSAIPTAEEDSRYTAIYTLLVSLISLSGGTLPDAKMERYLERLDLSDNTPIAEFEKTEKLMKRLEKDGYITRIKETTGTGDDDVYWVVGSRGKIEVGDDGIRGLTKTVFGELDPEEDEELERKIRRSLAISERASDRQAVLPSVNRNERSRRPKRKASQQEDADEEPGEDEGEDG